MSTLIPVPLPDHPYTVAIARGGLAEIGQFLHQLPAGLPPLGRKILLVSNPVIFRHYGEKVITALEQDDFQVSTCLLPAGERYKTLKSVQKIFDAALAHRLERSSTIVALGGGVVGDMAGFAAASWMRGINVIQIPTTLLAMVDAAIGGKTGVNHPQGKNLIGAFHQPRLVLIDPNTLKTLPAREFRAAIAEVIKYGVIWDAALFERLEACDRIDHLNTFPPDLLDQVLARSCQAKVDVITQDEKESGLRAILNYGHTIGHAIESLTGYRQINHGEGVALGMVAAGLIAQYLGLWDKSAVQRQQGLLIKAKLPTTLPAGLAIPAILDLLQTDKKVKAGRVRFVLPTQIGQATITDQVSSEVVIQALETMQA